MDEFIDKLKSLLFMAKVVVVRCLQWGDTGKGKVIDVLSPWADIIIRPLGGPNAGHTIYLNGKPMIFHSLPSGIIKDRDGKINLLGSGMVIDPKSLIEEIELLKSQGFSCENLKISQKANLILPTHILEDRLREYLSGNGKIGTTGKGVGPAYTDHVARTGLTVNDLLNPQVFRSKLLRNIEQKMLLFKGVDLKIIEQVLSSSDLNLGKYFSPDNIINVEDICEDYFAYGRTLEKFIIDAEKFIRENIGKKRILLEGAQGLLLSINYGTYPFVTCSDPSLEGMVKGAGLSMSDVDLDLGIIKGFMETRVGEGPFPTEIGDIHSRSFCSKCPNKEDEKFRYPGPYSINHPDPFLQGIALRRKAKEYGATTKRPRRVGWLDLVLLKHALQSGAKDTKLVLTKLDVLSGVKTINVCVEYKYVGPDYRYGQKLFKTGDRVSSPPMYSEFLAYCEPVYKSFPGWSKDISKLKNYSDMPQQLKNILEFIYQNLKTEPVILSVGPNPEETLVIDFFSEEKI
ncbi:MAG: adenylosuccinate synthetase [Candidatus Pacebacteria bacterium]|nr:adenylosuccinate synthetase [Candidatus Paceibacterota bacterium]